MIKDQVSGLAILVLSVLGDHTLRLVRIRLAVDHPADHSLPSSRLDSGHRSMDWVYDGDNTP